MDDEGQEVTYADGRREGYDLLLIASGSRPLIPEVQGLNEVESFTLRTLSDCRRLLPALRKSGDVIIIGGGLIGMHVAAVLSEQGRRVTVIEKEDRVLPLYFGAEVSSWVEKVFRAQGAIILTGETVRQRSIPYISLRWISMVP